jgi:hypothetical protein
LALPTIMGSVGWPVHIIDVMTVDARTFNAVPAFHSVLQLIIIY